MVGGYWGAETEGEWGSWCVSVLKKLSWWRRMEEAALHAVKLHEPPLLRPLTLVELHHMKLMI